MNAQVFAVTALMNLSKENAELRKLHKQIVAVLRKYRNHLDDSNPELNTELNFIIATLERK